MKLIFLDVDGVLIPARNYFTTKYANKIDPLAIEALYAIVERTQAKIVFNSVWNRSIDRLMDLITGTGMSNLCFFHETEFGHTKYPEVPSRLEAIEDYLQQIQDPKYTDDIITVTHWVALDDEMIMHRNAIWVDPELGITPDVYRRALLTLDNPEPFVVLL